MKNYFMDWTPTEINNGRVVIPKTAKVVSFTVTSSKGVEVDLSNVFIDGVFFMNTQYEEILIPASRWQRLIYKLKKWWKFHRKG